MYIVCSDLEGVLIPEIWIHLAETLGIEELHLTTRDISDYDILMKKRLKILKENRITLAKIQEIIKTMTPLEGAVEFSNWLRSVTRMIIVSDTYIEFARPLMPALSHPTLLCHSLKVDSNGFIDDYILRQPDPKRKVVAAFHSLQYKVFCFGDSYNDIPMLEEADKGVLFSPSKKVTDDYPEYDIAQDYNALRKILKKYII